MTNYFCPECGMTLYWHMDVLPKITGIAISVFDVDYFDMPEESIWEKFKRPWVEFSYSSSTYMVKVSEGF